MRWSDIRPYPGRQPPGSHIRRRPAIGSIQTQNRYPDYLAHYGVFGQKWGVRRYQNEDGTLTEEGKRRYNKPESENWKKSDAEHLSDEELNRRNSRLQRERQYKDLTTSEVERERNQFKKDLFKKALIIPVTAAVALLGKYYITKHADQIPDLIDKFKNVAVSRMNRGIQGGKLLTNSAKRYSGTARKVASKMYNYRPRINNSLPRMRNWPKIW